MKRIWETFFTACIYLGVFINADAQTKIDSLLHSLVSSSPSEAVAIHLKLCYEYNDETKVLYHAKRAYTIAAELGDSVGIVRAGRIVGRGYKLFNHVDSAVDVLSYISPIAQRNDLTFEYGQLQNSLGMAYIFKASYAEALKCLFESLSAMQKLDNKQWISTALFNIGLVYYKIQDPEKALEYYNRSYELKKSIDYSVSMDMLLINIGLCYTQTKNYDKTREYVARALAFCKQGCTDELKTEAQYALGLVCFLEQKMDKAEGHFLKSYSLAKGIDDGRLQFDNVIMLSKIYQRHGRLQETENILKEAKALLSKTSYSLEAIKLYKQFFSLYEQKGDIKNMTFYQRKYIQLKDSVYNEDFTNSLMRVQAEYLERENRTRIAAQQQMLELKNKVIVRQRWLTILAGIGAVLLIAIVYVLYKSNLQRKAANQLLDRRVEERTRELGASYAHLQKTLEENDLSFKKMLEDLNSSVATARGLSALALKEVAALGNRQHYEKLDETINHLDEVLREIKSKQ